MQLVSRVTQTSSVKPGECSFKENAVSGHYKYSVQYSSWALLWQAGLQWYTHSEVQSRGRVVCTWGNADWAVTLGDTQPSGLRSELYHHTGVRVVQETGTSLNWNMLWTRLRDVRWRDSRQSRRMEEHRVQTGHFHCCLGLFWDCRPIEFTESCCRYSVLCPMTGQEHQ